MNTPPCVKLKPLHSATCCWGVEVIEDPPRNPAKLHALMSDGWVGCPHSMTLSRPCPARGEPCAEPAGEPSL